MSNFVTIETEENKIKIKNLLNIGAFVGFAWILFHFTIIFFFGLILKSVLLVGIFLGIGNLTALFLDIPIGVLQKYIKPKIFILFATSLMFFVIIIFLKFIYLESIKEILPGGDGLIVEATEVLGVFLNSGLNIFLILLAACLYGIIKESYDVTIFSYIFNNSTPSEYASIISRYNIYFGTGSMLGLILSGILLSLYIKIAILIFGIIIIIFFIFIFYYFDNKIDTVDIEKIKNIKLDVLKTNLLEKKTKIIANINTQNFLDLSKKTKIILLKPLEIKKEINFKDIYETSIDGFRSFLIIVFGIPRNILILWFFAIIMQYGFWDTFVATFQIEFLGKILNENQDTFLVQKSYGIMNGYVFLGILVIPAFVFQDFFIKKSEKHGIFNIMIFGLLISSFSLFCFGIFDNIYLIIIFGILNSIGYAASMPISQATFSGIYNEEYSKKYNLKQIDSTVSAAPLKIVLNFANVIGLVLGALFVELLGFDGFFILFSIFIFVFSLYSLIIIKSKMKNFSIQDE